MSESASKNHGIDDSQGQWHNTDSLSNLVIERDALKAEVAEAHIDCIHLQQEINMLRMPPCQLPHCESEIAKLKELHRLDEEMIAGLTKNCQDWAKKLEDLEAEYEDFKKLFRGHKEYCDECLKFKLKAARLAEYIQHDSICILRTWSAGEQTASGGYRSKYDGQWYETKPIDKTPKCTCGLDEAWKSYREQGGEGKA